MSSSSNDTYFSHDEMRLWFKTHWVCVTTKKSLLHFLIKLIYKKKIKNSRNDIVILYGYTCICSLLFFTPFLPYIWCLPFLYVNNLNLVGVLFTKTIKITYYLNSPMEKMSFFLYYFYIKSLVDFKNLFFYKNCFETWINYYSDD